MTPQEELDLANLRYREIADEFNRIKSERDQIAQVAKDYINATPEQQQNASAEMQNLVNRYNQLWTMRDNIQSEIVWATERIAAAESAVRKAQPTQQSAWQKKRVVKAPNPAPTPIPESIIPEGYTEESISQYGLIGPQEEPYPMPENTLEQQPINVVLEEYVEGETRPMPQQRLVWWRVNVRPTYWANTLTTPYVASSTPNFLVTQSNNEWQDLYNQYRTAYLRDWYRWVWNFFRGLWINPYNYPQWMNNVRNRLYASWVPMNLVNAFINDWLESYTP